MLRTERERFDQRFVARHGSIAPAPTKKYVHVKHQAFKKKLSNMCPQVRSTGIGHNTSSFSRPRCLRQGLHCTRRCIQRSAPLTLCKKLTFTDHSHRTRGSGNSLRPFRPSSRPCTLSFSNRAPLLWNNLPPSIQQAPSTPSFKSNYLKYLLCSPNSAQHLELALGNPLC